MSRQYQAPEFVPRFVAALIDGIAIGVVTSILATILSFIYLGFLAYLAGVAAFLLRDVLPSLVQPGKGYEGQSLGKKVMNLKTNNFKSGKPLTQKESILRNLPLVGGMVSGFFYALPIPVIGALLGVVAGLAGLAAGLFDLYRYFTDANGLRWGDHLAGTAVESLDPPVAQEAPISGAEAS